MKAVIMAGGKGTRISSITTDIPKAMLPIVNQPIIEHQIECLKKSGVTDITIVIGHLGDVIKNYLQDGSNFGVQIHYLEETSPLGTAGALYYLKEEFNDDFIFLFGDVFLSVDFTRMMNYHKEKESEATLFVHPNIHPYDSVLVENDSHDQITGIDSKRVAREYDYKNNVNAGIFIFSPKVFDFIPEPKKMDLENEVIIPMIQSGHHLYTYKSTEYAKDMGTPERYQAVNRDCLSGLVESRNLSNPQKCIFLDRDGTINEYVGFLRKKEDLRLLPDVAEAIRSINNSEYLCIVVTNQAVVARGEVTFEELEEIHKHLETLLGNEGVYVDDIFYCPHHPHKGYEGEIPELKFDCDCRKPKTGLIERACEKYHIDINNSYIIGDSTIDIMLGKNANIQSILVLTGEAGNDHKYEVEPDMVADDLNQAVHKILEKRMKKNGF